MNTVLKSTEYAKEVLARTNDRQGRNLTVEERNRREEIPQIFRAALEKVEAGVHDVWRNLYDDLFPLWVNEVDHEGNRNLSHWGGYFLDNAFYARGGRDLFNNFNNFMVATRGVDSETVNSWISRIDEAFARFKQTTFFTYEGFYTASFPLEWLDYFVDNNRYYGGQVITAFNNGYTPELLRKTHHTVWAVCSPEYVSEFLETGKPAILNSLTQLGSRGSTVLTEAVVADLIDAGYEKMSEVKDYARKFGIGWTDSDFFTRTAAAKRKYPILANYTPEI